ncbi:MAG TPA: peptidoglycan DD-metalloendopeptidase family protein [candidate division Zixibacteria bacterium]|nr:peptidoglycan DD-metalloendopeptidase family protein [candidate division Zixibacteria bacterium]
MRRRAHLAVTFVALLTVGGTLLTTTHREPALAADPIAQAKAERAAIERQLADQRARLSELKNRSATLAQQLDIAKAELAQITAEYERVVGLLNQVRQQVAEIKARLEELRSEIAALDDQLKAVAAQIAHQTNELHAREELLEDHLRSAYEQSQTSLLEIILSADSLDAATNQVGYLLTVSQQDRQLADEIESIREQLDVKEDTLRDGRHALRLARIEASREEAVLETRQAELSALEQRTAELKAAAERKRAEQEAALNASLQAQQDVAAQIEANERAFAAKTELVNRLVAEQAALEEARRREAEAARKRAQQPSPSGFRWPEAAPRITQEWGPTDFQLEPPYTYRDTWYPHFHAGIDMASGCGTPIMAAKAGVVVASGQPLYPYDTGFGVIIDHGGGIQTWYWHLTTRVVVQPGQIVTSGQIIGYEGSTGFSTGCHLHFATNVHGVWENPRNYLP